jgi:N6-adenosine-specific RNA methylase IME4
MSWPFETLTPMKYGVILADPPWSYKMYSHKGHAKSPEAHYDTMALDDIAALPVGHLAAKDCLLFMWTTWPHLVQAHHVMKSWGFEYKTGGAWFKKMSKGASAFGTGFIFRSSTEPFLVGTIGRPKLSLKNVRNEILTD